MVLKTMKRGDIWVVDFDPATGHEQKGHRPAAVMSSDRIDIVSLGLAFVVPGTKTARTDSAGRPLPNHLCVNPTSQNGLIYPTFFMGEQLRSVSVERFIKRMGALTQDELYELEDIEIMLLGLGPK